MGEMKVIIPDEIEKAFRRSAMIRYGYQRGAISQAAKHAFEQWSKSNKSKEGIRSDRTLLDFKGILKHVKKTSVELQHEAWDSIAKKHVNR